MGYFFPETFFNVIAQHEEVLAIDGWVAIARGF